MDVLTPALSALALLSAVPCISTLIPSAPMRAGKPNVFKPLATTAILLIAALTPAAAGPFYQAAILIGLGLSLLGDVCLMLSGERWFVAGLVSFLLAHLAYIAGCAA